MTQINRMNEVNTDPKAVLARLSASAEIVETPCADGQMVWQRWPVAPGATGAPLVLLHGGFGSWTHWIANIRELSKDRPVVTADLPGLGDSADAPEPLSPDGIAAVVNGGLDAVLGSGTRFDLAGFSFGGLIGSRVAAMAGDRCRTFVAVGASGFQGLHVRVLGIRVPDPALPDAEIDAIQHENLKILMLWDESKIDPLAILTHRLNVARSRVRSRPMSLSNALVEALPNIRARIAGIWGVHDATGGGREGIEKRRDVFRAHQPDAPFEIVEDAGHWVMYERPDVFHAALRRVLA